MLLDQSGLCDVEQGCHGVGGWFGCIFLTLVSALCLSLNSTVQSLARSLRFCDDLCVPCLFPLLYIQNTILFPCQIIRTTQGPINQNAALLRLFRLFRFGRKKSPDEVRLWLLHWYDRRIIRLNSAGYRKMYCCKLKSYSYRYSIVLFGMRVAPIARIVWTSRSSASSRFS